MHRSFLIARRRLTAVFCVCALGGISFAQVSVRSVKVLGAKGAVEIEVEASDRVMPQTRVLTDPDRLVVDFPNSVPGAQLRSQSVDRGGVKDIRVGLFQAKPPVTRIVLDLKTAQSFQVFPYGRTVMIKVTGDQTAGVSAATGSSPSIVPSGVVRASAVPGSIVPATYTTRVEPVAAAPPEPALQVSYRNGLLGIRANKATLAEVLTAIQQQTGADISSAPGAEQEIVAADIEPAPAPEVLARLLNGSKFNFLIVSAADDARKLDRVILTARTEGYIPPLPMPENDPAAQEVAPVPDPPNVAPPPTGPSNPQPDPPPPNPEPQPPQQLN